MFKLIFSFIQHSCPTFLNIPANTLNRLNNDLVNGVVTGVRVYNEIQEDKNVGPQHVLTEISGIASQYPHYPGYPLHGYLKATDTLLVLEKHNELPGKTCHWSGGLGPLVPTLNM